MENKENLTTCSPPCSPTQICKGSVCGCASNQIPCPDGVTCVYAIEQCPNPCGSQKLCPNHTGCCDTVNQCYTTSTGKDGCCPATQVGMGSVCGCPDGETFCLDKVTCAGPGQCPSNCPKDQVLCKDNRKCCEAGQCCPSSDGTTICCPNAQVCMNGVCGCPGGQSKCADGITCCSDTTQKCSPKGTDGDCNCCLLGQEFGPNHTCQACGTAGTFCSPTGPKPVCYNGTCYPLAQCHNDNSICCDVGQEPCGAGCCATGQCCNNTTCNSGSGKRCCPDGTLVSTEACCPHGSCDTPKVCVGAGLGLLGQCMYKCNDGTYCLEPCCNGGCCPVNQSCATDPNNASSQMCCPSGYVNSTGICCPSGSVNTGGICCPVGYVNVDNICCPLNTNNMGGICCYVGQTNCNGECGYACGNTCCKANLKCITRWIPAGAGMQRTYDCG